MEEDDDDDDLLSIGVGAPSPGSIRVTQVSTYASKGLLESKADVGRTLHIFCFS